VSERLLLVRKFFSKLTYLSDSRDRIWVRSLMVQRFLKQRFPSLALDVGCGDGSLSSWMLGGCQKLVLNDLSEKMLERARRVTRSNLNSEKVKFLVGDILTVDLDGDVFDVILCVGVLAHVDDPQALLQKLDTCCRVGGHIIVETTPSPRVIGENFRRALKKSAEVDFNYASYNKNRVSLAQISGWCGDMGWTLERSEQFSVPFVGFGYLPVFVRCIYSWLTWKIPPLSSIGNEYILLYRKN
jgi:SAM-dependent methyltransferase